MTIGKLRGKVTFTEKEQQFPYEEAATGAGWWQLCPRHRDKPRAGGQGLNILEPTFSLAIAHLTNRRKLMEGERFFPGQAGYKHSSDSS